MSASDAIEVQDELAEADHERRTLETATTSNLNAAARDEPRPSERYDHLRFLADYDFAEETERVLVQEFSRDFVLANFSEAQEHEAQWLARVTRKEAEIRHPPPESVFQGAIREYVSNGRAHGSRALTAEERIQLDSTEKRIRSRITRGLEGFQQEKESEVRRVSEAIEHNSEDDDDGGWF